MNDLRLLLQVDPHKKIISLEFKQIASLQPMMPLLQKFQTLQCLSLHGNRLKQLPRDMSSLANLVELDISNNLFRNIQQVITSLKTIPQLSSLVYSFRNNQQEDLVRSELPSLERLNKKPLVNKNQAYISNRQRGQKSYQLTQQNLQEVGKIYDQIREIYKSSKYMVDKQLTMDFDHNVDSIMNQFAQKMKIISSQAGVNSNVICCKYSLLDLCFVKLITYFYHFDKRTAVTLQKIHDYQADLFKNLTEIIKHEQQKKKVQINNITLQKQQLYKKQIRRLKEYQKQVQRQLDQYESHNQKLIDQMIKLGKDDILQRVIGKALSKNKQNSSRSPISKSPNKASAKSQKQIIVTMNNLTKHLNLHQLKQIIGQIYGSKQKHNEVCKDTGHVMETIQEHMYTYLNQKYGLKSITVEWAMNIINGIKRYGPQNVQIAAFGRVLRNQLDQSFLVNLKKLRVQFYHQLKRFKGLESQHVTLYQVQQILLNMQIKRQSIVQILEKIRTNESLSNNLTSASQVQKIILDFFLKKQYEKLQPMINAFKQADIDQDGKIDEEGVQILVKKLQNHFTKQQLMRFLDNHCTGTITFSHFCEVVFYVPQLRQIILQHTK